MPIGTLFGPADSDNFYVSLGMAGSTAVLAWKADKVIFGASISYRLRHSAPDQPPDLQWMHILDWEDWTVYPSDVLSPLHNFLLTSGKLAQHPVGISLLQTDTPCNPWSGARRTASSN